MNRIVIAALAAAALTGCGTARFITTQTWFGEDHLYVATSEVKQSLFSASWTANVISCAHQADHSLVCTQQTELNNFLNADNTER